MDGEGVDCSNFFLVHGTSTVTELRTDTVNDILIIIRLEVNPPK